MNLGMFGFWMFASWLGLLVWFTEVLCDFADAVLFMFTLRVEPGCLCCDVWSFIGDDM